MQADTVAPKPTPGWVRALRWVFFVGLWLFIAGVLVQAFLAGQGFFGGTGFEAHAGLGWPLAHLLAPLLLVVSLLTRIGWRLHVVAAAVFAVAAVVPILASLRADAPAVAALHPLSAMVTFGLALYVAIRLGPKVMPKQATQSKS